VIVNPQYAYRSPVGDPENSPRGFFTAISGHRFYSPSLGRFINKDPIEEQGGLNLYGFCGNNGVNRWDYLGMVDDYMRTRADGSTYFDYGGYIHGSDFVSYKNAGVATEGGSSYGSGVWIGSTVPGAGGFVDAHATSLTTQKALYDHAIEVLKREDERKAASQNDGKEPTVIIHPFQVLDVDGNPSASNNPAGRDPDIGPDEVRYVGPMLPSDRGRAVTNALLLGNTVTSVNGVGVSVAGAVIRNVSAKTILQNVGRRIGVAGVLLAGTQIVHEGGFTLRNSADLGVAGASLIFPNPYVEVSAAIYTVATVTYDLSQLPPPPEPQIYRPPPEPAAPSSRGPR
jgi:RHS repeat-associated protein